MSAVSSAARAVTFTLNGSPVTVQADGETTLLQALREQLDIISPKNGCQPQGACGCCTVLVDGRARLSCTMKAAAVAGKHVTTLEGLSEQERRMIAECFVRSGGVQCGFCIPGIAIRAYALLDRNPSPTRKEIVNELRAHLCRCTGYKKIIDAVELLGRVRRGETGVPEAQAGRACQSPRGGIGTSLDRYSGQEVVLGQRRFVDDIKIPGMAYAALRFSDHPRALVKAIDVAAAVLLPGVIRVLTAADVPGDRYIGLIAQDWPVLVAVGEETRCVGDVLAVVVAEDERTARKAAALVSIDYEVREPVTTPHEGLKPDAPKLHPEGNLLSRSALRRGDVERAFAKSAHVIEDTYRTQSIEHMFLEPESCIAIPGRADSSEEKPTPNKPRDSNPWAFAPGAPAPGSVESLRVLTQGQGVFDDRRQIAKILGWPEERVYVELVSNGGAFGGKEDLSIQGQTALGAALTGRPVKCTLNRRESFRLHPKRHAIEMHYKVGCDAEGRLTAVWARMIGDKGAYASVGAKVLERAGGHATGPYRVANVDIESLAVYTNNPPCGAMRGFGVNQSAFAMEGLLDRLAEKVGIDGWEIRWRNALDVGDRFCSGQLVEKAIGLKKTLLAVKEAYRSAKFAGIACGVKNVGIGNGMPDIGRAMLTVNDDATITIRTGFTEMGQGLFTICVQTAVEQTGLPPEVFRVTTDTSEPLNCGQTTASRATVLAGNSIIEACKKLSADLASLPGGSDRASIEAAGELLRRLAGRRYFGEWICDYTHKLGADVAEPKTHLTYGFATQVVILNDDGSLAKVVACHDVGRVLNRPQLEGQIEGAVHMGLGYALSEEFVTQRSQLVTKDIKSVGVLRAHQMPEVEVLFVEEPDPECPYGARGVGEIGLVPTAPAVAGALYRYDHVVRTKLPMKDSPAGKAISCQLSAVSQRARNSECQ
jgi:CO/xanthine dehydrogenase Mo-binding subunit/aerobic-type carbon monoxide dehydrogenase small subunit (CoxS/CutS family)